MVDTAEKEKVLVIPKKLVFDNGIIADTQDILDAIDRGSFFMNRDAAETDEDFLQIIPYVVIRYLDENFDQEKYFDSDFVFAYQRLKNSSESRLHNKYSLGVGGHINPVDTNDTTPSFNHVINAALREIDEEIAIKDHEIEEVNLFLNEEEDPIIYDDSNPVGRVHLGIIFTYESPEKDITVKETTKIEGKLFSISEINLLKKDKEKFENWSNIVINRILS